jgi:hypothetical protein
MKIKITVTDGVAALYRESYGEEWREVMQGDVTELNLAFLALRGANIRDYPGDDFPFVEWEMEGVAVMFQVQGRGAPPTFLLRGEWERLTDPPLNRPDTFFAWHKTFMEFEIAKKAGLGAIHD